MRVHPLGLIPYGRIEPSFVDTAKHRRTTSQLLGADAATVFELFADERGWEQWLGLTRVRWTSELGPGATRTVWNGPIVLGEEFLVWEEPHELVFRFTNGPLPMRRAGERWQLHDYGDGTCRLDWTYAAEGGVAPIFVKQLDVMARRQLPELATYVAAHA